MFKPRRLNKRQAKKWRKNCDNAEWLYFMSGLYPLDYRAAKYVQRWLDRETKDKKHIWNS